MRVIVSDGSVITVVAVVSGGVTTCAVSKFCGSCGFGFAGVISPVFEQAANVRQSVAARAKNVIFFMFFLLYKYI